MKIRDVLYSYQRATKYDPSWYKAWHAWALANFEVVDYIDSQTRGLEEVPVPDIVVHIIAAIDGRASPLEMTRI
jgi:serine/threonine-protein kinase mTOR